MTHRLHLTLGYDLSYIGLFFGLLTLAACGAEKATAPRAEVLVEVDAGDVDPDAEVLLEVDAGDVEPDGGEVDAACSKANWFGAAQDEPFVASVVPLLELCKHMSCPADMATLLQEVTPTAFAFEDGRCGLRAVSGCGLESVYRHFFLPALSWHYKSDTGELVGVSRLDDVASVSIGGCFEAAYQAGEGAGPCPEATTRDLCVSADEGG